MTNQLGVDLYLLHEAGKTHLPKAAEVYGQIKTQRLDAVSLPDSSYWNDTLTAARRIIGDAQNNVLNAGTVLRLIAYSYAAQDSGAAEQLKESGDMSELPTYNEDGGWSDGTPGGPMKDQN